MQVVVDGTPLTIDQVVAVAERRADAVPGPRLDEAMAPARDLIRRLIADDVVTYGVTTGFGALASTRIEPEQAAELQVDLVRSHAAGVGPLLDPAIVRAMLLLRARTLAHGHSGVRPEVVRFLLDLLSRDLLPAVPAQGSVGASGDLAPFAHLALPLIGEGEIVVAGVPRPSAEVLAGNGIAPLTLEPKEGLSLLNGTEGMLAMGCLAVHRARRLVDAADAACALSVEALLGSLRPFDERIHRLRPHPGQAASAALIARLLGGSEIGASHREDFAHAVQDAYSLRCAPQVHGAVRDTIDHAAAVFGRELGAVVDNPIVFPEDGEVVSGGNFHGQPLAFALDFLAIATTELGSISERRTDRILDPDRSAGLPPFLAARPGVNSGYMLAQYTAASLVAENRVLAHPASIDSIPTSGLQEDHVSMGWGAGRKLFEVLANTERVIAVELVCAAAGAEHRAPMRTAPGTGALIDLIRTVVPPLGDDRPVGRDIEAAATLIREGQVAAAITATAPR
ncbi:MAG: histidine ammonia-lyase [Actinobacteria bacterium]|nr:MAG: histidine ammonia-lyase [Actinomycetota bacterium]